MYRKSNLFQVHVYGPRLVYTYEKKGDVADLSFQDLRLFMERPQSAEDGPLQSKREWSTLSRKATVGRGQ